MVMSQNKTQLYFFQYLLIIWIGLMVQRFIFWGFNRDYLSPNWPDALISLKFDFCWIGFVGLFLYPLVVGLQYIKNIRWKPGLSAGLLLLPLIFQVLTECWDLAFFEYTLKRTSFDMYSFYWFGPEKKQFSHLIKDHWHFVVLAFFELCVFVFFAIRIANRFDSIKITRSTFLTFLVSLCLFFMLARQSLGPKPLGILDAYNVKNSSNVPWVLNSPFNVLKTTQNEVLNDVYQQGSKNLVFNPIQHFHSSKSEKKPNLIFIILESFGAQQIKQTINGRPLTPFIDSILSQSCYYPNGMSNGKMSMEVLPSVFAGMPSWLETPLILSNYSTNQLSGFPSLAQKKGYKSIFFHGAQKGSMRFDTYAKSLGFQMAYWAEDYPNQKEHDGAWGIYDGAFLDFMGQKLQQTKQPFLSTFFSLSSHEPWRIPYFFLNYPRGASKEQRSYAYTDWSLKTFFKKYQKENWFKQSIFIFLGDHTPVHLDRNARKVSDKFRIPIAFYQPKTFKPSIKESPMEHVDIVPTLCKILDWNASIYGFGKDVRERKYNIRRLNGIFYIFETDFEIEYHETNNSWRVIVKNAKNVNPNEKNNVYLRLEAAKKDFLAQLQRYRRDLIQNRTH